MRESWRVEWGEALRRIDIRLLIVAFGIVFAVWAMLMLGGAMLDGDTQKLDDKILLTVREWSRKIQGKRAWLDHAFRDATTLGSFTNLGILSLAVIIFFILRRRYLPFLIIAASWAGGYYTIKWLKNIYDRPRPAVVRALDQAGGTSFPSGHALISAVIFLTLGALVASEARERRMRIFAISLSFILVFLVGFSRVYLGVHYPSDVLAGWTLGLVWAIACWSISYFWPTRKAAKNNYKF